MTMDSEERRSLTEAEILAQFVAADEEPLPTDMYFVRRPDPDNPGKTKVLYSFGVQAIKNEQFTAARKRATTGTRNKGNEETDQTRFFAAVVLTATRQPWRKVLWDNRDLWKKSGHTNAIDFIGDKLLPGDLDGAYRMVEELSGFGAKDAGSPDDADIADIKNL